MSFLARIAPWLFEEVKPPATSQSGASTNGSQTGAPMTTAARADRFMHEQIRAKEPEMTKVLALTQKMTQNGDKDVRTLLSQRLAQLVEKQDLNNNPDNARMLVESLQLLAEDPLTDVRIALSSALKDVAQTPHPIARQLAQDAERAVAEPIIRYSLSLSDDDLLHLIAAHPKGWQTVTIAGRKRVSGDVSNAVIDTGNIAAGSALIANDGAFIPQDTAKRLQDDPAYHLAMTQRHTLLRRLKRDWMTLTERNLYTFLRNTAQLDKKTTKDVMDIMYKRMNTAQLLEKTAPIDLTEDQLRDALLMGEEKIVIAALAARTGCDTDTVQRMLIGAQAAKPVISLCAFAELSPQFSVLLQQRVARLSPDKILYPKDGKNWPLSGEDMQWQLEFFGVTQQHNSSARMAPKPTL